MADTTDTPNTSSSGSVDNLINNNMVPMPASNPASAATMAAAGSPTPYGITDIVGTATGAISAVTSAINSATTVVNGAIESLMAGVNVGSNPFAVLTSDLSSLVQSATSTVSDIKDSVDDTIGGLTSNLSSLAQGPLEVVSQIGSLAGSAMEAIATPVAFITKPIGDVLEGVGSIPELMGSGIDWLGDMSSDLLGDISSATGIDITDTSSLKDAIASAAGTFSSGLDGAKDLFGSAMDVGGGIFDAAKEYGGALAAGAGGAYNAIMGEEGGLVSSVMDNAQSIISTAAQALPDGMAEWVSEKSEDFLASQEEKIKDKLNNNVASVITKVTGVGISNDAVTSIFQAMYGFGTSNEGLTTDDGTSLYATIGTAQASAVDKLYAVARQLCTNIKTPDYTDYDKNKDLYDVLLGLAGKYGLSDLINQLIACQEQGKLYLDSRSIALLVDCFKDVCAEGNPFAFNSILSAVTISNVPNLVDKIKNLGANLADDFGFADEYNDLVASAGIDLIDLLRFDNKSSSDSASQSALVTYDEDNDPEPEPEPTPITGENVVLSGFDVVVMCSSTTKVVDRVIGTETRFLTQAAVAQYATY